VSPLLADALVRDLLLILAIGLAIGGLCRRLGISLVVGFMLAGVLVGEGGLDLVAGTREEIEALARMGALFLLFAVGVEVSFAELHAIRRPFLIGGALQMTLVMVPVFGVGLQLGLTPRGAVLLGAAVAFSSTVLVFKALLEHGAASSRAGRGAVGVLLFQDMALIPVMLLLPAVAAAGHDAPDMRLVGVLALAGAVIVGGVVIRRFLMTLLAELRSPELVLLLALTVLGGCAFGAYVAGLPASLGAFTAGLILSGTRLTKQIDALLLPFRETFAALFFVSVGMLLRPAIVVEQPAAAIFGTLTVAGWKVVAATVALRAAGLDWRAALGMGLALAQLGEFGFIVMSETLRSGLMPQDVYDRLLVIAMATVLGTPLLVRIGTRLARGDRHEEDPLPALRGAPGGSRAVVIGAGPVGRSAASGLETRGFTVVLIDRSPVNLQSFAQLGFLTVSGDALERATLVRAGAADARVVVVSVPEDAAARDITTRLRALNPSALVLVRCRYQRHAPDLRAAGATIVVSEEAEAANALGRALERIRLD
jgi:CPA2 family monovalent cation:H+ antiporter-2